MPHLQTVLKAPFRVLRAAWRAVRPPAPRPVRTPRSPAAPATPPPPRPPLDLAVEGTPNPLALKFVCGVPVVGRGSLVAADAEAARGQPLAEALFALDGVASVFATRDFVTVTRSADGPPWGVLEPRVAEVLQRVVER